SESREGIHDVLFVRSRAATGGGCEMAGKSSRFRRALLAAMRIALWFEEGKSNKIWVGEQMGAALRTTWGRRTSFKRSSSVKGFPTEEKAAAALTKAATKKEAEGYRRAPSNAHELLWGRIALRCEDSDGVIRVSEVGSSVAMVENPWGTHY